MITKEHAGPLVYGGLVTLSKWYDEKRISEAKITDKDTFKMYSTYVYLGIGIASLVATVWWRRYQAWTDKLASGFLYGLSGFIYDAVKATQSTTTSSAGAIAQANRILAQKRATAQQLGAGRTTQRSYEHEFNQAVVF